MQNEKILNELIEKGHQAYKRAIRKHCPYIARMLDRKEPVEFQDCTYRCWTELVIDCMGRLIQEELPHSQCTVTLDMNNSIIEVELTELDALTVQTRLALLV